MSNQFIRRANLTFISSGAAPGTDNGIDVSDLRFKFDIILNDVETPNTAVIRVYNLSAQTQQKILKEFDQVRLQAGYVGGNYGTIFQGNIKQIKRGKENNIDSYLEVYAGDGDFFYIFGYASTPVPAGTSALNTVLTILQSANASVTGSTPVVLSEQAQQLLASVQESTGGVPLPRGSVFNNLYRVHMRAIAESIGARWSIQNGQIVLIPNTGFVAATAISVNSQTGMIGIPESTDNGVTVTTLLNPYYEIGQPLVINERDVVATTPAFNNPLNTNVQGTDTATFFATVASDGRYRIMTIKMSGDTRDTVWYSNLICLAIDPSSNKVLVSG